MHSTVFVRKFHIRQRSLAGRFDHSLSSTDSFLPSESPSKGLFSLELRSFSPFPRTVPWTRLSIDLQRAPAATVTAIGLEGSASKNSHWGVQLDTESGRDTQERSYALHCGVGTPRRAGHHPPRAGCGSKMRENLPRGLHLDLDPGLGGIRYFHSRKAVWASRGDSGSGDGGEYG